MSTKRKIVFDHDPYPDFSWLDQDCYNPDHPSYEPVYDSLEDMHAKRNPLDGHWYRNPANHVALEMLVLELTDDSDDWQIVDSLGGIDFLWPANDWITGTFYRVSDLPIACEYQRELAREAGLPA